MTERDQFGPSLRRERERRGITLEQIAAVTKVSASLFAAMERNDFSRWPNGIFRRSFLRAYAEGVGLDGEALVQRYQELFPSQEHDHSATPPAISSQSAKSSENNVDDESMRIGIRGASSRAQADRHAARAERVAATLADLGLVALPGVVGWFLAGWLGAGPAAALAGTLIFIVSNVLLGKTPGSWLMNRRLAPALAVASDAAPATARPVLTEERVITKRRSHIDPHPPARRHAVRRVERSRSRRA